MDEPYNSDDPQDQYRLSPGELDADAPQQLFILSLSGGGCRGRWSDDTVAFFVGPCMILAIA